MSDMASNATEKLSDATGQISEKISDATSQAKDFVSDKMSQLSSRMHDMEMPDYSRYMDTVRSQARMHPTETIVISAAVGFLLGVMLRPSR